MEIAKLVLEYIRVIIWPAVIITIVLLFKQQLHEIVLQLQSASLPGGISFDFNKEVKNVARLSEQVEEVKPPEHAKDKSLIPLTQANERLIALGLQPSPSGLDMNRYREIAETDTNLALAGLRIDLEVLARNLARGFNIAHSPHESGFQLLRTLYRHDAITENQYLLAQKVWSLSNAAIHGRNVTQEQANQIINAASILAEQYIAWLSWGFNDGWRPEN